MPSPPWVVEVEPARSESESRPSASPAYRSSSFPGGFHDPENATTVLNLWRTNVKRFPNRQCLGAGDDATGGRRNFRFQSYKDVDTVVRKIAGPLETFTSTDRKNIGIFSGNCPEWMIGFLGCMRAGLCAVPVHDSPQVASVEHIISHAELPLVMVSAAKLGRLASALETTLRIVKCVVYWQWPGVIQEEISKHVTALSSMGCEVFSFQDFQKKRDIMLGGPRPDTLATILYSTGIAGDTKGAMLTHSQLITSVAACEAHFKLNGLKIRSRDSFLAYLPVAHSFEMCLELLIIKGGGKIGYSLGGNPKSILEDARALKPTVFLGVPTVLDRMVDTIEESVKSSFILGKLLFHWGYNRKKAFLSSGIPVGKASPVFDTLVFGKYHKLLGGRQRLMLNFGTPSTSGAQELLAVCMRCPCLQGYGTREGSSVFIPHFNRMEMIGTVGTALPSVTWRVESVPDLGHNALDEQKPAGELVLKSPLLFQSYYKEPELVKECYDEDGWFHSGDYGIVQDGCFKIIDQKENIITLADGKHISGEAVERTYKECDVVHQIWVYGDSEREDLVAIVVPDETALQTWAESEGMMDEYETMCKDSAAVDFVLKNLADLAAEQGLQRDSTVQAVRLSSESLVNDSEFLTPSSKFNRHALAKKFEQEIRQMYSELDPTPTPTPTPAPAPGAGLAQ